LIYLNPRPTRRALMDFYPEEYPPHQSVHDTTGRVPGRAMRLAKAWAVRWSIRGLGFDPGEVSETLRRVGDFPPHFPFAFFPTKPGGRLLDVGCGTGIYLDAFRRLGWDVCGVEISAEAAERARTHLGLNIITGELEDARLPDEHFDIITLIHVVEHLPDPVRTLTEVCRILKKGGLALLALPNVRSLTRYLFGSYWFPLDVPRHLQSFSPRTLRRLVARVKGLRPVKVNHLPVAIGLTGSWAYLCRDYPLLGKVLWPGLVSRLAPLAAWALALIRLSDSIVVYVRKAA